MNALVVSTVFAFGLLLLYDGLVRPEVEVHPIARLRRMGPAAAGAFGGATAALIATAWPVVVIAGGFVGGSIPGALRRSRQDRLVLARREAIAEVSSRLRDAIRSGIGLFDALTQAAAHAPDAIAADLRRLVSDARVGGIAEASASFAERLHDPAAEMLASALAIADRMGSRNLSETLDALAEATTSHAATVREARAHQTRARMSARIVAGIPLLLLLAIKRANPSYLAPFSSPSGQAVMAFAIAMVWAGYLVMKRAARIEEGVR